MKIYLTRHSKTVWNTEKRLQGRKDSPLIQEGIENAIELKQYIKNTQIDYIYSSPIPRAFKTAQLIFDNHLIIQDNRIQEMNFGVFEGMKIKDILATNFTLYDNLWNHPENFTRIPEGESYEEVVLRVTEFIEDLKKLPKDSVVFIMTHGMCFIVLLCTMLGYKIKDFVRYNQNVVNGCSLTCVNYDKYEFKLEYYNDCSFLSNSETISFRK